jgi:hypothetical protein
MDLEQWTVGGRGFGVVLVYLLMAGEVLRWSMPPASFDSECREYDHNGFLRGADASFRAARPRREGQESSYQDHLDV